MSTVYYNQLQGIVPVDAETGLAIDAVLGTDGKRRLCVDAALTVDNVVINTRPLTPQTDTVSIGDNSTGDKLTINPDGSLNANVVLSSGTDSVTAYQGGVWTTGRTWSLSLGSDSVNAAQSGTWNLNDISGVISLPTGASTSGNQVTANASLASIDSKLTSPLSVTGPLTDAQLRATPVPVSGTFFQAVQPVSQSGTWTVGRTWTLASGTDSIAAVQSGTWNINNISGTISLPTGAATESTLSTLNGKIPSGLTVTSTRLLVDGSGVTQPISAASLPLPTGASTSALQITANTSLASIDSKLTSPLSVTGPLTDTQLRATPVPISGTVTFSNSSISVTQGTSPWVTSRNWTLASGTDSVSAVQSGTWNINNISGVVSLPTGASTLAAQTTGNTSLASIDGKLNSLGQKTMANSVPVTIASDQSAIQVVGNAASAVSDSGNPVKVAAVFNSTLPTVTNGQRVDNQADANGRLITVSVPVDGVKATYSAAATGIVLATTPTDVFTITGSASKTIRVLRIVISGVETTVNQYNILAIKRSTANSGGTSSTLTNVPYDSTNAAATATVRSYTANPTLGTTVGTVRVTKLTVTATGANQITTPLEWDFGNRPGQAVVLRGTGEVLAINFNSVTITGSNMDFYVEWTEE